MTDSSPAWEAIAASTKVTFSLPVATRADGSTVSFPVLVARGAKPGKTLLVTAGVHGDEYEGMAALHDVFDALDPPQLAGTFVAIPIVNGPAYEAGLRVNPDDRQDLAIVEGVIGLARTFGCRVVAEGVESPAQARLLIEMGCDLGQGHGIASPMPATEVFRWVRDYRGPFAITAAPVPDPQAGETVEPLRVSAGVEPPTTI